MGLALAGYAPGTINLTLAAMRGLLRHCRKLRLLAPDDFEDLREVRRVRSRGSIAGRALDREEIEHLFGAAGALPHPLRERDLALLAISFSAGARRAEIAALNLDDYGRDRPAVRIRSGKGGRDRLAFLTRGATIHIDAWIEVRGSDAGPLLNPVSSHGWIQRGRLSATTVYERFRQLAAAAGIGHVTPHDARRTVATSMLRAGIDVNVVARQTGHASLDVLRGSYDRRGDDVVSQAVRDAIVVPA